MSELDELRLRIAKAKGVTFWDSIDKLGPWPRKNNPVAAFYAGGIPLYKVDDPDPAKITWYDNDPDWPRDIAAAWELVEEMLEANGENACFNMWMDDGFWGCICGAWVPVSGGKRGYPLRIAPESRSAPEAICRAYLAWKEGSHE